MNKTPGITYFAETDSRNKRTPFGIKLDDRSRHMYLIGKTGMGKSTVLENMAVQDIQNGNGLAFIDPHGKTADLFLEYIPEERKKDVIYFAPFDTDHPIAFNVMEDVGVDKRHLVANGLMSAFKRIWVDAWSARMEYILNNTMLALLEYPGSTLIGINRMFADKDYRKEVVSKVTDPSVKTFWTDEFAKYNDKYAQEATAAIQNKIGQFIANPLVRNIIGQPKSDLDFRKIMDEKKILIINLSKGRVGEANANLLGSMIITKVYLAAMSRADSSEKELANLPNFYLYVDEFQNFANESFADILSEARKYKLNLTVAHQYIEQMSEEVRAAVFGNVGTMVSFRVGAFDAEVLEKEFAPEFTMEDMVNLGRFQIYLKLMIDGVSSPPFSASTLPQIEKPIISYAKEIIEYSRAHYAKPRSIVEDEIREWHAPIVSTSPIVADNRGGERNTGKKGGEMHVSERGERRAPQGNNGNFAPREQRAYPNNSANQTLAKITNDAQSPQPPQPPQPTREEKKEVYQPFKTVFSNPPKRNQSSEDAEERETELRKAMSLSYARKSDRPERGDVIKNKKEPTPENISALQSVLKSVLGEMKTGEENIINSITENRMFEQRNAEAYSRTQASSKIAHEQKSPEPMKEAPTPKPREVKEIPEDVLRKMLE